VDLWWDAVGALREALRVAEQQGEDLTLARANLGIAYLVHPSGERDTGAALRHLEMAAQSASADSSLSESARASVSVNYAVSLLSDGDLTRARDELADSEAASQRDRNPTEIVAALTYNRALVDMLMGDESLPDAADGFESFLRRTSPTSLWWREAYRFYESTNQQLDRPYISLEDLRRANRIANGPRLIASVPTAGGTLSLNQSAGEAMEALGRTTSIDTLIAGTNIVRVTGENGLGFVAGDRVIAITVTDAQTGIPISFRGPSGDRGSQSELRVGITKDEFKSALGEYAGYFEPSLFLNPDLTYYFYRDLGIAARFSGDELAEVVVSQIP
jgi:hypothetical protein